MLLLNHADLGVPMVSVQFFDPGPGFTGSGHLGRQDRQNPRTTADHGVPARRTRLAHTWSHGRPILTQDPACPEQPRRVVCRLGWRPSPRADGGSGDPKLKATRQLLSRRLVAYRQSDRRSMNQLKITVLRYNRVEVVEICRPPPVSRTRGHRIGSRAMSSSSV